MVVLAFLILGFLRFSNLSNSKRNDFILHNTYMSIFIEKSKTDTYIKIHWPHLAKLNSDLFSLELTKRYFVLARIAKQYDKYVFRGIENTKNGQNLKKIDKPLTLKKLGVSLTPSPVFFSKNASYRDVMTRCFSVTFNMIISYIFSEYLIEIPQVLIIIINFSGFLTFPCYKETNDISI